jgi:hypothetical protein
VSSAKDMTCMSCGKTKAWPDAFPNTTMAECWDCAWKAHLRSDHPRLVRKARRAAEKRARLRFRAEAHREVEADLLRDGYLTPKAGQQPTPTTTGDERG